MAVFTATASAPRAAVTAADRAKTLKRLSRLARTMDTAIKIPFVKTRLGADALLGLIPGLGDMAGLLVSSYVLAEAWRLGAPGSLLVKMAGNIAMDTGLGAVPILGDIFDVYFKSNIRNLNLLLDHLGETSKASA
jgi:hypothetical protein